MGPEMLLLVGAGTGGAGVRRRGCRLGNAGQRGGEVGGRQAMPPITIIFHHPNYIAECVSVVACAHPVLLLGKERGRET